MVKRRLILSTLLVLSMVATALQGATIPRQAPDLSIAMTGGGPVSLSQYKGKVVAMIFILTTCPHCQKTIGFLTKAQSDFGPRGFQVLAAAIEQGAPEHVPGFIKTFNTNFPVGTIDPMKAITWMQHPAMVTPLMPLLAFVDRQGKIRAQMEGDNEKFFNDQQEQNLRTQVEALLKEGAVTKKAPMTTTSVPKKASSN